MMKVRLFQTMAIVSFAAAMSGCVSYGNTHALVTPVGIAGYHTFKPDDAKPTRDINLPEQRTPDRIAATNEQSQSHGNDAREDGEARDEI